ncbi:sensor domain-containing diguanylate cyclase [Vibrio atypicus]|uniref:sensor domain-containing diguanylate cyclase n=1 Tax=Vibrio atypicus TaxID=558271 RepID=UPI0037368FF6
MARRKNVVSYLITTTLFFTLVVTTYYIHKYNQVKQQVITQTAKQAAHQLAYSEREYLSARNQFLSIIELLSHSRNMHDYIQHSAQDHKMIVEGVWSSVAINQKWYSQIRYINLQGIEEIKVSYSDHQVVVGNSYEDKSQRAYFLKAQELSQNQIGSWGVDLEYKNGEIALPYQPTLRLFTPVFVDDMKAGYLVLNIDVWYLASRLNYSPDELFKPELIDDDGFFLAGDNQTKLFGHLIERRAQYNFSIDYPASWFSMQEDQSGYLVENDHLVVYNRIRLSPEQQLYLVINFSPEQLDDIAKGELEDLVQEAILVVLLMFAFVVPTTWLVIYYRKRSVESQLARAALSGMSAVIISDRNHRVILVNDEFTRLTGLALQEIASKNSLSKLLGDEQLDRMLFIFEQVASNHFWEGEVVLKRFGNSESVTAILRVQSVRAKSGRVSYYISSLVDISDRKQLEERLRMLSEKDELTQLWNRRKFELEIRSCSRLQERYPQGADTCLSLLDIDYFKRVNDELGHDEGDRVITRVGSIIQETLRETDFVARIGGEEFAIILPHTTIKEAELALERVRVAVEIAPDLSVTISAGVTDLLSDNTRSYKLADIALYEAKTSGRNRVSTCLSSADVA